MENKQNPDFTSIARELDNLFMPEYRATEEDAMWERAASYLDAYEKNGNGRNKERYALKDLRFPLSAKRSMVPLLFFMDYENHGEPFVTEPMVCETENALCKVQVFRNAIPTELDLEYGSYPVTASRLFKDFIHILDMESRAPGGADALMSELDTVLGDAPVIVLAGHLYEGDYEHDEEKGTRWEIRKKHERFWEKHGFQNVNGIIDSYSESVPMLRCNKNAIDSIFRMVAEEDELNGTKAGRLAKMREKGHSVYETVLAEQGYEVENWHKIRKKEPDVPNGNKTADPESIESLMEAMGMVDYENAEKALRVLKESIPENRFTKILSRIMDGASKEKGLLLHDLSQDLAYVIWNLDDIRDNLGLEGIPATDGNVKAICDDLYVKGLADRSIAMGNDIIREACAMAKKSGHVTV